MTQATTIHAYAALEAGGKLEAFSYEADELAAHQVEIDVNHCGVCHSDLSMLDNEWGFSNYPLVAGHEVVGRVAAVGSAVSKVKPGDSVGLGWHAGYCGDCFSCDTGDQNLCAAAQPTIVGHHGGFANKVRADDTAVARIPEGIDLQTAGPLLCAGITVFNPLLQFDVKSSDKVAVIGVGGLGHLAVQFLKAWGCEVTAFTSSDTKRKEALELGAHHTLNSRDEKEIEAAAGSFDFVLSTVNVKLDWNLYINTLKPKGRLHFVGATLEPLDLSLFSMLLTQRSVSSSPVGSPASIEQMFEFALQHNIKPQVEVYPMQQVNEAIAHLKEGKAKYRIVLSNN
ncbi:MAG: NAD(P)-dependent alcohol dehydrogenase [Cellvibrionaceae bacterium]|nr:NAD(P)-dependent alcohol dehydrogenase [Cellvibrionaceae bacterium]